MQIISLFTRVSQSWPDSVLAFLRLSSFFNFEFELFSPACAVPISFWSYYQMQMLAPLFFVGFLFAVMGCLELWQRYKKRKNNVERDGPDPISRVIYIIVFILSNMFTFLATKVLGPLECYRQPDRTFTMYLSPTNNCFEGEWAQNYGSVVFYAFLYLGLAPFSILVVFFIRRKHIWDREFLWKFGALIRPYKKTLFFWELVATFKKTMFVVLIKALADISIFGRLFYLICFLVVFLGIENLFLPFRTRDLNGLNAYWNIVAVFLLLSDALVFEPQSAKAAGQAIVATMVIVMMLFDLFMSFHRVIINLIFSKKYGAEAEKAMNDAREDAANRPKAIDTTGGSVPLSSVKSDPSGDAPPPPPPASQGVFDDEDDEDRYVAGAPKLGFGMGIFAPSSPVVEVNSVGRLTVLERSPSEAALPQPNGPKSPSMAAERMEKARDLRNRLDSDATGI
jgi:hypothetical protein